MELLERTEIESVNRNKPFGYLVGKYGDNQYWLGFGHGLMVGLVVGIWFATVQKA
jgi:hypothetical protein